MYSVDILATEEATRPHANKILYPFIPLPPVLEIIDSSILRISIFSLPKTSKFVAIASKVGKIWKSLDSKTWKFVTNQSCSAFPFEPSSDGALVIDAEVIPGMEYGVIVSVNDGKIWSNFSEVSTIYAPISIKTQIKKLIDIWGKPKEVRGNSMGETSEIVNFAQPRSNLPTQGEIAAPPMRQENPIKAYKPKSTTTGTEYICVAPEGIMLDTTTKIRHGQSVYVTEVKGETLVTNDGLKLAIRGKSGNICFEFARVSTETLKPASTSVSKSESVVLFIIDSHHVIPGRTCPLDAPPQKVKPEVTPSATKTVESSKASHLSPFEYMKILELEYLAKKAAQINPTNGDPSSEEEEADVKEKKQSAENVHSEMNESVSVEAKKKPLSDFKSISIHLKRISISESWGIKLDWNSFPPKFLNIKESSPAGKFPDQLIPGDQLISVNGNLRSLQTYYTKSDLYLDLVFIRPLEKGGDNLGENKEALSILKRKDAEQKGDKPFNLVLDYSTLPPTVLDIVNGDKYKEISIGDRIIKINHYYIHKLTREEIERLLASKKPLNFVVRKKWETDMKELYKLYTEEEGQDLEFKALANKEQKGFRVLPIEKPAMVQKEEKEAVLLEKEAVLVEKVVGKESTTVLLKKAVTSQPLTENIKGKDEVNKSLVKSSSMVMPNYSVEGTEKGVRGIGGFDMMATQSFTGSMTGSFTGSNAELQKKTSGPVLVVEKTQEELPERKEEQKIVVLETGQSSTSVEMGIKNAPSKDMSETVEIGVPIVTQMHSNAVPKTESSDAIVSSSNQSGDAEKAEATPMMPIEPIVPTKVAEENNVLKEISSRNESKEPVSAPGQIEPPSAGQESVPSSDGLSPFPVLEQLNPEGSVEKAPGWSAFLDPDLGNTLETLNDDDPVEKKEAKQSAFKAKVAKLQALSVFLNSKSDEVEKLKNRIDQESSLRGWGFTADDLSKSLFTFVQEAPSASGLKRSDAFTNLAEIIKVITAQASLTDLFLEVYKNQNLVRSRTADGTEVLRVEIKRASVEESWGFNWRKDAFETENRRIIDSLIEGSPASVAVKQGEALELLSVNKMEEFEEIGKLLEMRTSINCEFAYNV
jgi:hypothetical protein